MLERTILVLFLAAAVRAEEPAPAEPDPHALLTAALQKLKVADRVSAAVSVEHAPPEADNAQPGAPGGFGGAVITTQIMGEAAPFEGRLEACREADGTTVLLSEKELPGFALYATEARAIERTTFEDDRFSLEQLRGELTAILDPAEFVRRIVDAKLTPTRGESGTFTFRGKVDRDIVPATGGEMAFTQGRVLGAEATLVVKADGTLASAAVKIVRSDVAREMMRGPGMRQIMIMGGAPMPPADDDKKHDIVGGSTTYTITFREGAAMSDRAKAFKAEVERLLGRPEHGDPLPPGKGGAEERK
jgi:hypothetical protein